MAERDELLTIDEVMEWTGLARQTLSNMRARGEGPASFKIGTARGNPIRYRRSAVEAWLKELEQAEAARLQRLKAG
jgi:predicted DNA-binding transcriptional regulator AlpA